MKAPVLSMFTRKAEIEAAPDIEAATLRSDRFRLQREGEWKRLDAILTALEKGKLRKLSDDDVLELPALYRMAASSLAVARETSLDSATLAYLESLVQRAWFQVYGPRVGLIAWLRKFFGGNLSRATWCPHTDFGSVLSSNNARKQLFEWFTNNAKYRIDVPALGVREQMKLTVCREDEMASSVDFDVTAEDADA